MYLNFYMPTIARVVPVKDERWNGCSTSAFAQKLRRDQFYLPIRRGQSPHQPLSCLNQSHDLVVRTELDTPTVAPKVPKVHRR
jgi:hypothetical protein